MAATERSPKISVNKLGEYIVQADSTRRRKIVHGQKYPNDAKPVIIQYAAAARAIVASISAGQIDPKALLAAATKLRSDGSGTPKALSNRANDAAAIEAFIDVLPQLPDGALFSPGPRQQAERISIAGLSVSVAPDLLIPMDRNGKALLGALKLHFVMDGERALGKDGSQAVAVLVQRWLTEHGPRGRVVTPSLCLSVEVFRKTVYCAPTSQQRRLERIEDACAEIAARWASI